MTMERRKYLALRLQELSPHSCIPANLTLQHVTDASLPLKFIVRFERSNADSYRRSDIIFDLKTARVCVSEGVYHAVRPFSRWTELTVILVQWSSKQVTKGTWRMREQCVYQALFPPPPHESLGTRLYAAIPDRQASLQMGSLIPRTKFELCSTTSLSI